MTDPATADRPTWSTTALARRAGMAPTTLAGLLREGLVPSYKTSPKLDRRLSAAIPAATAERLAVALSAGVVSTGVARLMRRDPARLAEALDLLADVARDEAAARAEVSAA